MLVSVEQAKQNWPNNCYVYVVPPGDDSEGHIFTERGFRMVDNIHDANIVVWTGGQDLNPALYGETPLADISFSTTRDAQEIKAWRNTVPQTFKVGICRGGQLLNVLNGGKLWQHVDNHFNTHTVRDIKTSQTRVVTSTHHQAFRPATGAEIVATAHLANMKFADGVAWYRKKARGIEIKDGIDYEILWYPKSRSLCFQGHPEYVMPADCTKYFFELIERYF